MGVAIFASLALSLACRKEINAEQLTETEFTEKISKDPLFIELYELSIISRDFFFRIRKSFNSNVTQEQATRLLSNTKSLDELKKNVKFITNTDEVYNRYVAWAEKQHEFWKKYESNLSKFSNKATIVTNAYFLVEKSENQESLTTNLDNNPCRAQFIKNGNRCQNTYGYGMAACAFLSGGILTGIACGIIVNLQYNGCIDDALEDLADCVAVNQ